jgi:hypothetical protein
MISLKVFVFCLFLLLGATLTWMTVSHIQMGPTGENEQERFIHLTPGYHI